MRNTGLFGARRTMGLVQKRQYYGLLTGLPVLANTSFNENEPIVCSPEGAIDCFLRTHMDLLVIGDSFCEKPSTVT